MTYTPIPLDRYTQHQYTTLQEAYDFYNASLFDGLLPECLITFNRRAHSRGYYCPQNFAERGNYTEVPEGEEPPEPNHIDEIALNPDAFVGRTDPEILSTLVHEMVHLWQQHFGNAPKSQYHNTEWANKMQSVGLRSSTTEDESGARTGGKMSHYILPDMAFDVCTQEFLQGGRIALRWQSQVVGPKEVKKNKVKYTCPTCGTNVWGKPDIVVVCGTCDEEFEVTA